MNKNNQIIFVGGHVMSGKQTLLYLLDGHPSLSTNFIHDKLMKTMKILQQNSKKNLEEELVILDTKHKEDIFIKSEKIKKKTQISIKELRRALDKSNYYHYERYSSLKIMPCFFSINGKKYLDYNFDFHNFEDGWKNDIFKNNNNKQINIEKLYNIFLKNYFKSWKDCTNDSSEKIFVTKLPNDVDSAEFVIEENFNSKILYVQRDLVGLLKSKTLNYIAYTKKNIKDFDNHFEHIAKSKYVELVLKETDKVNTLKKKYPDKIFLTSLEKLVYDTENEMKKIINFIQIDIHENLFKPTYCGKNIESDHLKNINDDQYEISEKNIFFANLRIKGLKYLFKSKLKFSFKLIKMILNSIYLKIRHY